MHFIDDNNSDSDSDSTVIDEAITCQRLGSDRCIYRPGTPRHELFMLIRFGADYDKKITPPKRSETAKLAALNYSMNKFANGRKNTKNPFRGK